MTDNVIVVRLVTGEYVVAKRLESPVEGLVLEDPLVFDIMQRAPGQFEMPCHPLIPLARPESKLTLLMRDVMFIVDEPAAPIVNQYIEAITPTNQKIVKPGDPTFRRLK